ncbi:recombinase zinc beta ribbon domain-containing protein [Hazenella sp. IB182357]|uniref:Recombinase zinc beta ribbon domain-containing protein n=2 Tax=Polycladospora coralii TaxID=2771432 RepID=A0A926NEW4_9BACL|nr:recombinase zinc beta ribbon domain-containing protein [Polycladospora coralii]MBS7530763.1 zinc ribbon domain-containing protein [Polycladospora coralii]
MSGTSRKYKGKRTKYYGCVNRQKNFHCDMSYLQEASIEEALLQYIHINLENTDIDEIRN